MVDSRAAQEEEAAEQTGSLLNPLEWGPQFRKWKQYFDINVLNSARPRPVAQREGALAPVQLGKRQVLANHRERRTLPHCHLPNCGAEAKTPLMGSARMAYAATLSLPNQNTHTQIKKTRLKCGAEAKTPLMGSARLLKLPHSHLVHLPKCGAEAKTPLMGSARMSYSRFLELIENRMIKRITIIGDGKCALIDLPLPLAGHDFMTQKYERRNMSRLYAKEFLEWKTEQIRFYVDLPGDFWYTTDIGGLARDVLPHRGGDRCALRCWAPSLSCP